MSIRPISLRSQWVSGGARERSRPTGPAFPCIPWRRAVTEEVLGGVPEVGTCDGRPVLLDGTLG